MVKMVQGGTQTEAAEFLELRTLQVASVQQQQQLIQAREELEVAQAQAAAAVNDVASNVAGERDDHYRSVVKHLERTHKQALDHERAAHAASLNNELTKQRQTIERRIRDELHEATVKRETMLQEALSELTTLRHRIARRDEELESLQAMSRSDCTPMARVPWLEPGIIMKLLDAGAAAVFPTGMSLEDLVRDVRALTNKVEQG